MKDIKWNFNEGRVLELESGAEHNHEIYGLTIERARQLKQVVFFYDLHVLPCSVHNVSLPTHLKRAYEHAQNIEEFMYILSEIYIMEGKNDLLHWISHHDVGMTALILSLTKNEAIGNPKKS